MADMCFFRHYMAAGYPYLSDGPDMTCITDIPLLTQQYEFLMHAIISLGALHLSLVVMDCSGPEKMGGYSAMLSHHSLTLHSLQQSIHKQTQAGLPTVSTMSNILKLNAMLATCYALTIQSSHLCDGFPDFLILICGCGWPPGHITAITRLNHSALPLKPGKGF
ncbi:hypothetical protein ACJ73_07202 [Blastomyces percursus]|uniref:Uncharacterized protein n=1 Tax=Blastomyces percursus TaxID=1658174 RepID=A0A1J9R094_9EURO|nr:hypothetical protein ACJ73_07202 [Blastomyces percursus]